MTQNRLLMAAYAEIVVGIPVLLALSMIALRSPRTGIVVYLIPFIVLGCFVFTVMCSGSKSAWLHVAGAIPATFVVWLVAVIALGARAIATSGLAGTQ